MTLALLAVPGLPTVANAVLPEPQRDNAGATDVVDIATDAGNAIVLRPPAGWRISDRGNQAVLRDGDSVVLVRRVLSFGEVPTVIDEIWLPGSLFRGLTAERLAEYKGPMYGLFESEFGVRMIRADEKIRAVAAGGPEAELLDIEAGTPLLQVERISFTYGDRPVEMRRGLYLTSRYHYRNSLN